MISSVAKVSILEPADQAGTQQFRRSEASASRQIVSRKSAKRGFLCAFARPPVKTRRHPSKASTIIAHAEQARLGQTNPPSPERPPTLECPKNSDESVSFTS